MTPTALTLGLARGERVHQPGDAGRARHVALHVLHAGGGFDRNAAGVEADALADEGDRRVTLLAAIPAHHHHAAVMRRALADAEQRVHAELFQLGDVEHLDRDAELLQRTGAAGEFLGIKHVGRLVDEIARQQRAFSDRGTRCIGAARRSDITDCDGHLAARRRLVVVLALGLVAVEGIGAQFNALRQIGGVIGAHRSARQFGEHARFGSALGQLAHGKAAEGHEVFLLQLGRLADADHHQPRHFQPLRNDQLKGGAVLAGEAFGLGGPGHQPGGGRNRLTGGGSEFEAVVAEHHENTAGGRGEGAKAELQGVGHHSNPYAGTNCRAGSQGPICAPRGALQRPKSLDLRAFHQTSRVAALPRLRRCRLARMAPLGRPLGSLGPLRSFTICCACSTALPLRGHFVARSRDCLRGLG